jgi:hypothetical protein
MSRKKKQASYSEQDVDHNRPTLEREIEMLRAENIRLIGRLRQQDQQGEALSILREVAQCAAWEDDPRIDYLEVQIDRELWAAIKEVKP